MGKVGPCSRGTMNSTRIISHAYPRESLSDIWHNDSGGASNLCHFLFSSLSTHIINGHLSPKSYKRVFNLVGACRRTREWQRPSVNYRHLSSLSPFCNIFLHPFVPLSRPFSLRESDLICHDHVLKEFSGLPLILESSSKSSAWSLWSSLISTSFYLPPSHLGPFTLAFSLSSDLPSSLPLLHLHSHPCPSLFLVT